MVSLFFENMIAIIAQASSQRQSIGVWTVPRVLRPDGSVIAGVTLTFGV